MILAVTCDQPTFKDVYFSRGLNVVLADRTQESTRKDTRNGLGKSTLIEIIHFCLGGSLPRRLNVEALSDWTFTLELELTGKSVSVSRNVERAARVSIEGDTSDWPLKPRLNRENGRLEFTISQWTSLLGALMFDLPIEEETRKYKPTFRGLISYFIRRGTDAYSTPFEHYRKQNEVDVQVFNAFLLGLDWKYGSEWQHLKDKDKVIKSLKQAAKTGLMSDMLGTLGEQEAIRVRMEAAVRLEKERLDTFQVHPRYQEIETRANELTREIHELENRNLADSQLVHLYKKSIEDEKPPSSTDLLRVYEEAGVIFPDIVWERFEDVRSFHQKLIENRRAFLDAEIELLNRIIESRRAESLQKSQEKTKLMEVLQTHGALEEYTRLQQLYLDKVSRLKDVELRIENLKKFEQGKSEITIEKELLTQRALNDVGERRAQLEKAITLFNDNSQTLYQAPGNLVIDIQQTGYKFDIEIERSGSQGIGNMKIFTYDLMLAQLWSASPTRPGFLIHDSTIFDGVDERQRALALELAERASEERGFQYICMLNSDMIPIKDFSPGFDLTKYTRLRLTDMTEDGRLLGIRF